jgi:hypothetical protein
MIFHIKGGLPHARAKAFVQETKQSNPKVVVLITGPQDDRSYYVEIGEQVLEGFFRAFLQDNGTRFQEMKMLPGGKRLQAKSSPDPVPKSTVEEITVMLGKLTDLLKGR